MSHLYLGTSSWYFDAWSGVFYPEALPRSQYLDFYAREFNTVEVNTSFYALPEPGTLIRWIETVPHGFMFALKFPRIISHEKRLDDCEPESKAFADVLRSLGDAAGPAYLQLPPSFTRARYGRALAGYLDWLAAAMDGMRIAVEVRSPDLMTSAFAHFLAERNMVLALVDRVDTPDLYEVWREASGQQGFVFVRWIGNDRNGPKGDRHLVSPVDSMLARWAQRIEDCLRLGLDVFGYMHNPYEGHAPASVRRLERQLAQRISLPKWPPSGLPPMDSIQMNLL
jgi:uncharacterized protein YecE (DUF72 family)